MRGANCTGLGSSLDVGKGEEGIKDGLGALSLGTLIGIEVRRMDWFNKNGKMMSSGWPC